MKTIALLSILVTILMAAPAAKAYAGWQPKYPFGGGGKVWDTALLWGSALWEREKIFVQ